VTRTRDKREYAWSPDSHVRGRLNPQAVGERLERLRVRHGSLTAGIVVADAADADSLLHPAFEWDDPTAAHEFRLEQARRLLRHIFVVDPAISPKPHRAFIVVTAEAGDAYQATRVVLSDAEMRAQVLQRAKAELDSWRRRYSDLKELSDLFVVVDQALAS